MYKSLEELIAAEKEKNIPLWKCAMQKDCLELDITEEEAFEKMKQMYLVMKESDAAYQADLMSRSGLVGGDGQRIHDARMAGKLICGDFIGRVIERAVKMGESNACMKRIVAAPTAGSCGVIPAVFITVQEEFGFTDEQMTEALFVAAGIGGVIAHRAFLAGAAGGCQAEVGSASSMAAGAIAYLKGADATGISHAAAIAMKNLLGLACDPVAGLVEVPCVKRNVIGAVNAMTSCDMVLAGVISKIPPDEVFDAMRAIGRSMPENIRETGTGGLAGTPTGVKMRERITSM
uniref:L-serine ammonia-lyase, iron-sulfur-dependent, subunit alpha n=1 Tax=Agathobacter sp. TaxID=2021311 RepID=UPI004055E68D